MQWVATGVVATGVIRAPLLNCRRVLLSARASGGGGQRQHCRTYAQSLESTASHLAYVRPAGTLDKQLARLLGAVRVDGSPGRLGGDQLQCGRLERLEQYVH